MSVATPPFPTSFGSYEIAALLGEGGSGHVYRARGPDGDTVALKLLKDDFAASERFRKRFAREAEAAMKVDHPRVVRTLDYGEVEGSLYLAQEFVDGPSLCETIQAEPEGLDIDRTIRLCLQVASGLDAVHNAGFVHRDVKPHNILLDRSDSAYVADFGLAKDQVPRTALTSKGEILGSANYMAPEQIRGEELDRRADVYSLGCVAFESLCGRAPFADRRGIQILWGHLREEPPDPKTLRPDLPGELGWAIGKALEKDPAARPPTATAFARMLQVARGGPAERRSTE
jgi:serine/threonine-protein kinase